MLSYRQVEVFHAIMMAGSVSGAAERLGLSQPSVSKTLQTMEYDLGYLLFDRIKGRLQPTEEARALLQEAERAREALQDVRSFARRLRHGEDSKLRVTATPALGLQVLPEAVSRFRELQPRSLFDISTHHSGAILDTISRKSFGFDVGFTFGAEGAESPVGSVEIGSVSLACVAKRGVLDNYPEEIGLEDLASLPVISLHESEPLGRLLAEKARELGLTLDTQIRVQTYGIACALAERGGGLAIVDAMTAVGHAQNNPAVDLRRFDASLSLPVTAIYPLARGLPVNTRRFVDAFAEVLDEKHASFLDRSAINPDMDI
ncbi:LysR substrate-binding domain-containing protein [Hyphomonas adhaerens]|uniref:LysR family transcriptional regulator n=2 Tax=Hyphomonas adhaerens TaxID=81029 RepID=A0A069E470_9PROT|nr:LysR substrate-binding domain-containing protein [Hyphomonas adhaerens]KCZ85035.1 LysR family transcriptional regulator [Hyphomonas adhaerens MHS-3]|tara:strand:+ start:4578 stop:5528 length:951 start_codon:yes stop_codon:yes gene_type:complete